MEHFLDITADVCPMTFVKARLLIERMQPGDTAVVLLRGEEPVANVPASVVELGHTVLGLAPLAEDADAAARAAPGAADAMCLRIRKSR